MLFGTKTCNIKFTLNDQEMQEVEVERDVGFLVATNLKPSQQCSATAIRGNRVLGQITRAVKDRDKKTVAELYKVYVRPHLEYYI